MKARIQTLMDEWEQTKTAYNKAVMKRETATLELDTQVATLISQIAKIEKEHAGDILRTEVAVSAAEVALKADVLEAWDSWEVFPAGKKRLPLDRGAWVQVAKRTKREVIDPSAAARFITHEGIEDTAIKKLVLDNDVIDAIMLVKRKFPGVRVSEVTSVSVSSPKTKKEE